VGIGIGAHVRKQFVKELVEGFMRVLRIENHNGNKEIPRTPKRVTIVGGEST